ncbi:MAG: hypothetical protein ACK5XS_01925 [Armatimonadota bacterium]|jgi:hypothetical protein|nr:hypothetical protein CCB81_01215 [Armatimonadetes bacterium Uphvl-Ar2]MCE2939444.1 hypothetical protein [Fimbriimonadaceae bacterium]MCZ8139433.1 hypothetical protein [Fimbriimonadaceae bacterium]HRD31049.1 hypothetical protein [Fimbriimonadaceae bacterium]HRE93439.1 hypothetical protein [Fimbriimonadaceae bacterium]
MARRRTRTLPAGADVDLLREALRADDYRLAREVIRTFIESALAGNPTALKELVSRLEPAPTEAPTPTTIEVVYRDE